MHSRPLRFRTTLLGLAAMALVGGGADAATCQQSKLGAAGKKTVAALTCHRTAVKKALAVSTTCLDAAGATFNLAFTKAEAKGGCPTTGDVAVVEAAVDACVSAILAACGTGSPPAPPAACLQAKLKASGKKAAGKLRCWAKAAAMSSPVNPMCLTKQETKFDTAFLKAELKPGCAQTGDAAAVEAVIDTCLGNVVALLPPPTTTTTTPTTTTTTTTLPVCGGSEPASVAGITAAHSTVRASASPTPMPPLDPFCWSPAAAAVAQAWADTCTWGHNPGRGPLGENIYAVGYTGPTPPGSPPLDAVSGWASEAADYDYGTNTCSSVCGHYTQIVWRDTEAVGCAVNACTTGSPFGPSFPNWTIVVCNYDPPGNYVGQWPY